MEKNIVSTLELIMQNKDTDEHPFFDIFHPKEGQDSINELKKVAGNLPDDYIEIISKLGIGALEGSGSDMGFFPIEDLINNTLNSIQELGHVFIFASDIGGNYYFYDIDNTSKLGYHSVFLISPASVAWKYSIFLGQTLTEVMEKIIDGEDFTEYKRGIIL